MDLVVNGEQRTLDEPMSVEALLARLGIEPGVVVVERNRAIVRRADFGETMLADGDAVEVVRFVCGG